MQEVHIDNDPEKISWLKEKLQAIWSSPKFCGLCLDYSGNLCSIDLELVVNRQTFSRCLRDILNYVFNENVENIMSSSYLCDDCTEKAILAFLFIHNAKQLSRIINNCISDVYSKVNDVSDQLDRTTGYENANVMVVLENDTDLYKSIIDTKMTEILPISTPIPMKKETPKLKISKEIEPETIQTSTEITQAFTEIIPASTEIIQTTTEIIQPTELFPKNIANIETNSTPNITLKKGHIVIKPLNSSRTLIPHYNTYQCASCPDIFTTYRSLKEHEKAKHKKTVYHCNMCGKLYNSKQYLYLHYKTHNKTKCKFCQTVLPEEDLQNHLRNKHSNLVFPCNYCNLVYYTQDSFTTHFNATHIVNNTKTNSQCIMCLKSFDEDTIKSHKCKFSCSECFVAPCIHHKYLVSYREQTLNYATKVKCIDCYYVTGRKDHLIGHVNREHLNHHPFTCNDCNQQFYTKLSLKTHIIQFHQDLNCKYCDFQFKDNNSLENHIKMCKSIIRAYSCIHCVASFDLEEELKNHENLKHSSSVYACKLCTSKFLTPLQLEEHRVRVHGGIQFKKRRKHIECTLCNLMFRNLKEMLQHEKTHDPNELFPCKVCPKKFRNLRKLYMHNQRHKNKIICTYCNKKVAASFYPQHAVRCPFKKDGLEGVSNHVCEACGKGFNLKSLLQLHQKIHIKRIQCPQCDRKIKASSLEGHIAQVHGNESKKLTKQPTTTLSCDLCGHVVRKKNDLEAHMNRYHYKIKPYVCDICNKDFCGKLRLKEHMSTHNKDNSCFCSVCGKKFANRVCLKMHFRMHTGELPYDCDICGQKFRTSSIMKTHRLKKHWSKTISCPLCDSMFYMVREMRHHFKKVHWKFKDKPFDVKKVPELSEKYYHLFEDGRLPKLHI